MFNIDIHQMDHDGNFISFASGQVQPDVALESYRKSLSASYDSLGSIVCLVEDDRIALVCHSYMSIESLGDYRLPSGVLWIYAFVGDPRSREFKSMRARALTLNRIHEPLVMHDSLIRELYGSK